MPVNAAITCVASATTSSRTATAGPVPFIGKLATNLIRSNHMYPFPIMRPAAIRAIHAVFARTMFDAAVGKTPARLSARPAR
jgi:hypothetical protein